MKDGRLLRAERRRLAIAEESCREAKKEGRKWAKADRKEERQRSVVRGGGEVWQNGPRGTRPPNWYLNTRAQQNCCYHKKLMN